VNQIRLIPEISEETLAEALGIAPSRVSFFMNRFRDSALLTMTAGLHVRKALLNVILHDSVS